MLERYPRRVAALVALRKESVDRNESPICEVLLDKVALRKESVDRNGVNNRNVANAVVALRKESVDRNSSSRCCQSPRRPVALRKESVDRNWQSIETPDSVSSRSPQGERG